MAIEEVICWQDALCRATTSTTISSSSSTVATLVLLHSSRLAMKVTAIWETTIRWGRVQTSTTIIIALLTRAMAIHLLLPRLPTTIHQAIHYHLRLFLKGCPRLLQRQRPRILLWIVTTAAIAPVSLIPHTSKTSPCLYLTTSITRDTHPVAASRAPHILHFNTTSTNATPAKARRLDRLLHHNINKYILPSVTLMPLKKSLTILTDPISPTKYQMHRHWSPRPLPWTRLLLFIRLPM